MGEDFAMGYAMGQDSNGGNGNDWFGGGGIWGLLILALLFGGLGDALTRKYNKYILKGSTMLIITMGLMLMIKGIRLL